MKVQFFRIFCVLSLMTLYACSAPLEQERLTFNAPLDLQEMEKMQANRADLDKQQLQRLQRAEQNRLKEQLHVALSPGQSKATPLFFGHAGENGDTGYAIYSDGSAVLRSGKGPISPLVPAQTRVFKTGIAGRKSEYIYARSADDVTVWNIKRPDEKLILQKVEQTFEKERIHDVVPLLQQNTMMISVNGGISVWSLSSGRQIVHYPLTDITARKLARNMGKGRYYFGTRTGEIYRLIPGHSRTPELIYKHSGPVLDILLDPDTGRLVTSSKDGSVVIWSEKDHKTQHRLTFSAPVYTLLEIPTSQTILAMPAKGAPVVLDIKSGSLSASGLPGKTRIKHIEFSHSQPVALARYGAQTITLLATDTKSRIWRSNPKLEGALSESVLADKRDLLILVDDRGAIYYFDVHKRKLLIKAVQSDIAITGITVNHSQTRLLAGLADGRVIAMDVDPEQKQTLIVSSK